MGRFICSNPHCLYAWHPFPECPYRPLEPAMVAATADRLLRLERESGIRLVRRESRYHLWLWVPIGLVVFVALVILI
ncbi:hypothetical protein [Nocardia cyriacigeorgica]|uniref:Uncharacterized protein n=1 Tax=Nocardia cyriacigeorgica TaxID=135487 RepID=A0A6P1DET5_9NOCA|nr:hypothetical protein [Nocardia cyriacigeorgica]NEW42513.1 hypothetical protein [Nocardia cyriacigeorgica]NEW48191.1 hypothetical protein [Nocardia cyriacigeorgica]